MTKENKKIRKLHTKANRILDSSLTWSEKYDLIFSDKISKKVMKIIHLDYYDPDTSYEEDVRAYMDAFNERIKTISC